MMGNDVTPVIDKQEQAFEQFVAEAVAILSPTRWEIGRIASESKEVTGKTDAELGERIGLSKQQVQARRAVWDRFGDNSNCRLSWTHYAVAVTWDDAEEVISVAKDESLSVADMQRFRRVKNGELEPTKEIPPITDEKISDEKLLTQPSIRKVTPETTKRTDTGTSGGEGLRQTDLVERASQVPPDEGDQSSSAGDTVDLPDTADAKSVSILRLKVLRQSVDDFCRAIVEAKLESDQRADVIQRLKQMINELEQQA